MKNALVLDIETVPLDAAMKVPYNEADNPPPANYAKPEAIAGHHEKGRAAYAVRRAKECSLNPRLGRVLCLGSSDGMDYAETEDREQSVLVRFWDRVVGHDGKVATWNGSFDLRFLLVRSLILGVTPTFGGTHIASWFRRYTYHPHFDCKMALLNWPSQFVTGEGLDEWATALGVPGKSGMTGADVYPRYLDGHHTEIAEYCADDVAATGAIFQRIQAAYL